MTRINAVVAVAVCGLVLVGCDTRNAVQDASPIAAHANTANIPVGRYRLDRSHSTVTFKVSHLGFSFYTASFSRFDATLDFDPVRVEDASLTATIDVTSLQIPAPPEGFLEELLGPNWLNAGNFPEMTYSSTQVTSTGRASARVTGNLTLNGTTVPVTLDVVFNGGYAGMEGLDPNARAGFSTHGTLRRSEFGIALGIPAAGSNLGVGDEVQFMIETEFSGPPLTVGQGGPPVEGPLAFRHPAATPAVAVYRLAWKD